MSEQLVREALEVALNTWATSNSVQVAWENTEFVPTADAVHARAYLLPGDKLSPFLAGVGRVHVGVFQVSLHMPQGYGTAAASALVESLDAAFTTTAPLTAGGVSVYITRPMGAGPALPGDSGAYVVPVSCAYRAPIA